MKICYHGTNKKNAQSILMEGFRPESWFSRHLEDAIDKGGSHVFQVVFDDPPDHWQFHLQDTIKPDRIVGYNIYQVEQKINNEILRKEVFNSQKNPLNRAARWRSFKYSEWEEKNNKFDHETWNKLMNAPFKDKDDSNKDFSIFVEELLTSRKEAEEACGSGPPFRPRAWYNAAGDILEVYLSDEPSYARWLNHQVSVLLDFKTDEVVGFQIWGLSLVKNMNEIHKKRISMEDEK